MKFKFQMPNNYPGDDPTNFYTTFQIIKIFGWKFGKIKGWIDGGLVDPAYRIEDRRGRKSYFAGYQLYMLGVFERLLAIGFPRRIAQVWTGRIENYLKNWEREKEAGKDLPEVNVIIFRISEIGPIEATIFHQLQELVISPDKSISDDFFVLNFRRIVERVDSLAE